MDHNEYEEGIIQIINEYLKNKCDIEAMSSFLHGIVELLAHIDELDNTDIKN